MPEHPCIGGLTKGCFAVYPDWAKRALAYKLLMLAIPKEFTGRLPKFLRMPFIGPGTTLPPGLNLPPGWVVPPDFTFPPEWKLGDPIPPGLYPPIEDIIPIPPGGPVPPIYIPPGQPGPPSTPGGRIQKPTPSTITLATQDECPSAFSVGGEELTKYVLTSVVSFTPGKVTSLKINIGKRGDPTYNVRLRLWRTDDVGRPISSISGGLSNIISASTLEEFESEVTFKTFTFPNKPSLAGIDYLGVCIFVSDFIDNSNCVRIGALYTPGKFIEVSGDESTWYDSFEGLTSLEIYGTSI